MATSSDLPEGTDRIDTGAGIDRDDETGRSTIGADNRGGAEAASGAQDATDGKTDGKTGGTADDIARAAFDWNPDALKAAFSGKAQGLFEQAGDHARSYVTQGLDRTTGALDDLVRMVEDAAAQIDDKVGSQYGDYVRQASGAVAGFADTLRAKDPDQVFEDAREAVRKSPAIAIGAAAAIGFALARVAKAGIPEPAPKAPGADAASPASGSTTAKPAA